MKVKKRVKGTGAELVGAGALALVVAAVYFISSPEREAGRGSSEAVAPKAQVTPALNSPAGTLATRAPKI